MITAVAIAIIFFIRYQKQLFDNGISGISWAFAPLAFVISIKDIKKNGWTAFRDPFLNMSLCLFFLIWLLATAYVSTTYSFFSDINLYHVIATLVGVIFVFIWRGKIDIKLTELNKNSKNTKSQLSGFDRVARFIGYFITLLNIIIVIIVYVFFL